MPSTVLLSITYTARYDKLEDDKPRCPDGFDTFWSLLFVFIGNPDDTSMLCTLVRLEASLLPRLCSLCLSPPSDLRAALLLGHGT